MATHSSILAWRIPGTEEPGGLPSMGSHRAGHDWSDLAAGAAATAYSIVVWLTYIMITIGSLVNIHYLMWIKKLKKLILVMKTLRICSLNSIHVWHTAVLITLIMDLTFLVCSYNWTFVSFDTIPSPPNLCLLVPQIWSFFLWVCFWSIIDP